MVLSDTTWSVGSGVISISEGVTVGVEVESGKVKIASCLTGTSRHYIQGSELILRTPRFPGL
jgi:hypothetical protein